MLKTDALEKLGGSVTTAAHLVGVTPSAVSQWPDVLPQPLIDRVVSALWRVENGIPAPLPKKLKPAPEAA